MNKTCNVICSVLVVFFISASSAAQAQDKNILAGGNIIYGVQTDPVCINAADFESVTLLLTDFVVSREVGLFRKDRYLGMMIESKITNEIDGETATVPAALELKFGDETADTWQFPVSRKPVIYNLDLDISEKQKIRLAEMTYKIVRTKKGTAFGQVVETLVGIAGKTLSNIFTIGTVDLSSLATKTFNAFFDTAKSDDKAYTDASINLLFGEHAGDCDEKAYRGTMVHVFAPTSMGDGYIPLTELNSYCYKSLRGNPSHDTVYWSRATNGCGEMPANAKKLLNPHIGFIVSATPRERFATETFPAEKGTEELLAICEDYELSPEFCMGQEVLN